MIVMRIDHTVGLSATWCRGPIYCSYVTRDLMLLQYPTLSSHLIPLHENETELITTRLSHTTPTTIHPPCHVHEDSFNVTLIPANHCPGAVMVLLVGAFGTILHTGDYRYLPSLHQHDMNLMKVMNSRIDVMITDTTFFHPRHMFPSASKVLTDLNECVTSYFRRVPPVRRSTTGPRERDEMDSRVYLSCDGLGSEPVLASLTHHFHFPIYINPHDASERYTQLHLLHPDLVTTHAYLTPFHLYAAADSKFQAFAQSDTAQRQQRQRQRQHTQQANSTIAHGYGYGSSCPALYVKPSTLWFTHNLQTIRSATAFGVNVQSDRYRGQYMGMGMDMDSSTVTVTVPSHSSLPTVLLDRYGVTHVLYSMHSDMKEIIQFIQHMQPKLVVPLCTPAGYQFHSTMTNDHTSTSSSLHDHDEDDSLSSVPMSSSSLRGSKKHRTVTNVQHQYNVARYVQQLINSHIPSNHTIQVIPASKLSADVDNANDVNVIPLTSSTSQSSSQSSGSDGSESDDDNSTINHHCSISIHSSPIVSSVIQQPIEPDRWSIPIPFTMFDFHLLPGTSVYVADDVPMKERTGLHEWYSCCHSSIHH